MKVFFNAIGWRAGFTLLLCGWLLGSGLADAATYAYRNDVFAYDAPSGAASSVSWHTGTASPACTVYPNGDDDWADVSFPSGFAFTFGGTSYSSVRVYANGILAFPPDTSGFHRDYTPQALPAPAGPTQTGCTTAAPVNIMLAYWIDIVAGTANNTTGASVQYELLGTAPNRRFVISWVNVKLYNQTARYNFQVTLYESAAGVNGNFRYQYTSGSSDGSNATVGVQLNQSDYTQYSYNQQFIDTTNGTSILWYPANQLQTKSAEYRFDESSWSGAAGEIKDTSGSSRDASRVGNAANVTNGKLCRGGSFTNNTSNATLDAVATPITPGNTGSVDFWYNSNNSWTTANTMLFDATTVANRPFFLMKRSTGALRFVVTDSAGTSITANSPAQSFAAGTWHHIGATWNMKVGTNLTVLQIYIDGVLQNGVPTRGTTNGSLGPVGTIYIGDNRTSGVTPNNGTPNGANGIIDEFYVYALEVSAPQFVADMNLTRPTCTTFDHFHIIHGGEVVNCDNPVANVTIQAHDVNHALFSLAGTTMALSTTPARGTWSNVTGGAINSLTGIGAGTGAASYTFSNESQVTFGLSNTLFESLNINATSGSITERSGAAGTCDAADYTSGTVCDASLAFKQAGFRIVDGSGNSVGNQVSGMTSGMYYLQAVKAADCATPGACPSACTALFPSGGSKSIDLAFECNNPAACLSGQTLTFTGLGTVAANNNGTISASSGNYTGRTLSFSAVAPNPLPSAPFTFYYTDAGQITLWARYSLGGGNYVSGKSSAFVVKPHHFDISNIACASITSSTCAPANATGNNPAATGTAGAAFIQAGQAFKATVTAKTCDSATAGCAMVTSAATPNFGQERNGLDGIVLTSYNHLPGPGGAADINRTILSPLAPVATPFSAGAATLANLSWDEVGVLQLRATLANANGYLGSDPCISPPCACGGTNAHGQHSICSSPDPYVGRFIPDHFDTMVTHGCAGGMYTYSGQPFTIQATARNLAGGATQNYFYNAIAGYSRDVTLSAWDSAGTAVNPGPGALTPVQPPVLMLASAFLSTAPGVALTPSPPTAASPVYNFTSRQTVPTLVRVRATDSDGISSLRGAPNPSNEGATLVRSGRARLLNAYGSELLDLPMTFRAEYWNGAGWTLNSADVCTGDTSLGAANTVSLSLAAVTPALWATCAWDSISAPSNLSGIGCASTAPAGRNYKEGATPGIGFAGDFNLWLKAPGAGKAGSGLVTPTVPAWLGVVPPTRATFGIYKSPVIYLRENY